jgi:hypothetical protein
MGANARRSVQKHASELALEISPTDFGWGRRIRAGIADPIDNVVFARALHIPYSGAAVALVFRCCGRIGIQVLRSH